MGRHEDCSPSAQRFDQQNEFALSIGVEIGRRFIEQNDLSALEQCPRHGDASSLASGETRTPLVKQCVQSLSATFNHGSQTGLFRSGLDLRAAGARAGKGDIIGERKREDHGRLSYPGQRRPLADFPVKRRAVDHDPPRMTGSEPDQHLQKAGFSRAGDPHQRGDAPLFGNEADRSDRWAAVIGDDDVFKADR